MEEKDVYCFCGYEASQTAEGNYYCPICDRNIIDVDGALKSKEDVIIMIKD